MPSTLSKQPVRPRLPKSSHRGRWLLPDERAAFWRALGTWGKSHYRAFTWRRHRPWMILLAETLLQRTRAEAVEAIFPEIEREFSTPAAFLGREARWHAITSALGLGTRRMAFPNTVAIIGTKHGSKVPVQSDELCALPNIGHYTAAAVRCFGYGLDDIIVDANTIRVACRVLGEFPPPRHRSRRAKEVVGSLYLRRTGGDEADNYAILDLAAVICRPRDPRCGECPVETWCASSEVKAGVAGNRPNVSERSGPMGQAD